MSADLRFALFVAALAIGGCLRDPAPGMDDEQTTPRVDGDEEPGDGDGDEDPGDGDGDGDGQPGDGDGDACSDEETLCDDTCVNTWTDPDNCGQCGRTCISRLDPILEGGCFAGECLPLYSECVSADDGLATCDEVCAAQSETCLPGTDPLECSHMAIGWFDGDAASCEAHFQEEGISLGSLGCGDALPFGEACGPFDKTCTHFVCCCTQTAQPP